MKRQRRNQRGVNLAEFAAVATIGGPLLICLIFVALECGRFYTIKSAMEVAARNGARGLVVAYNRNPQVDPSTTLKTVNFITMPHYVGSSNQFNVTWDTASPAKFVTVTCSYPVDGDSAHDLQPFPAGPLKWLTTSFNMGSTAVSGTYTWPVQ